MFTQTKVLPSPTTSSTPTAYPRSQVVACMKVLDIVQLNSKPQEFGIGILWSHKLYSQYPMRHQILHHSIPLPSLLQLIHMLFLSTPVRKCYIQSISMSLGLRMNQYLDTLQTLSRHMSIRTHSIHSTKTTASESHDVIYFWIKSFKILRNGTPYLHKSL